MRLIGMTFMWNEEKLIPYVMPYYDRLGIDKLIIYNNESTDNSIELLKKYPYVEIRTLKTDNVQLESMHIKLRNDFVNEFKNEKDTWLIICDFDEVLYYDGDFKNYLYQKGLEGYSFLNQQICELISYNFPIVNNSLIHENCEYCHFWEVPFGCKPMLLNTNIINSVSYNPGGHSATFESTMMPKSLNNMDIFSFHLKFIDYEYMRNRTFILHTRRSEENIQHGWGTLYTMYANDEAFKSLWNRLESEKFPVKDYLNKTRTGIFYPSVTWKNNQLNRK